MISENIFSTPIKQLPSNIKRVKQVMNKPEREVDTNYSIFDQVISKRRDVLKLLLISFIIIFALSFHSLVKYWLKFIIKLYSLSSKQALLIKLAYNVFNLIILLIIKVVLLK